MKQRDIVTVRPYGARDRERYVVAQSSPGVLHLERESIKDVSISRFYLCLYRDECGSWRSVVNGDVFEVLPVTPASFAILAA